MSRYEWHMQQIAWHKKQLKKCAFGDMVNYTIRKHRKQIAKNIQQSNALYRLINGKHEG